MKSLAKLLAVLAWLLAGLPAYALSPAQQQVIFQNLCQQVKVSVDFVRGQYCIGSQSVSNAQSIPGWSFTRASAGYAQTGAGTLVSFGSGVPRITDLGLLDELSATNLALSSSDLTNGTYWAASAITIAGGAAAPDGTASAVTLTESATTAAHAMTAASGVNISYTSGQTYTQSVYVKAGSGSLVQLTFGITQFSGGGYANFDLSTCSRVGSGGTFVSATATPLSGGWCRLSITATATSTGSASGGAGLIFINVAAAGRSQSYLGTGKTVIAFGPQMEIGTAVSSYIVTTSATVTRAADALTLTYAPAGSAATVTYGTNSTASVSPTSPINLGSSSGGAWVGNYIRKLVVTP